jgi:hypothetical protein
VPKNLEGLASTDVVSTGIPLTILRKSSGIARAVPTLDR